MNSEQLRRIPRQKRSQKRYDTIVEAAAGLFASQGFDATTMEAIAAVAETSIGSLYQFFPNKIEVFRAIARKWLERSEKIFPKIIAGASLETWPKVLDAAIDTHAEQLSNDQCLRALWVNFHLYDEFSAEDDAVMRGFIASIDWTLSAAAPELTARKRKSVATTLVRAIQAMLISSSRENLSTAKDMLEETKIMLRRYLELYLPLPKSEIEPTASPSSPKYRSSRKHTNSGHPTK